MPPQTPGQVKTVAESRPATMTWADLYKRVTEPWRQGVAEAVATFRDRVTSNAEAFRAVCEEYIANLAISYANMTDIYAMMRQHPNTPGAEKVLIQLADLRERYFLLATLLMANTTRAADGVTFFGLAPALLVGAAGLSVVAVCICAAYLSHTRELREHTAFLRKELQARVEAMRTGKELPPTTAPPRPDDKGGDKIDWMFYGFAAAALLGGAALIWPAIRNPVGAK